MTRSGIGRAYRLIVSSLVGMLLSLLLSGCVFQRGTADAEGLGYQPFIPPTLVPTPLPTSTPSPTPVVEEETGSDPADTAVDSSAGCTDNLTFIGDLTIPDGTHVSAGSTLDKQWQVENSGTCNWEEGYEIRLISGQEMGAESGQALIPARSGSRVTVRIVFTAPGETGDYTSAWQAYNPEGNAFGDPFYIDITVD